MGWVQGSKMMFGYFQRSQWAWITTFYRMSKFNFVQKLLQFQFRKFGRISHKFPDKNEFLEYITQKDSRPTIFVQNGWNFYQMTTTCRETKLSIQNFPKILINFVPLHVVVIWWKFQPFWTKIVGRESFCVRYPKISFLSGYLREILPNTWNWNCNNF